MLNSLNDLKEESYPLYLSCKFAPKNLRNALAAMQLLDLSLKNILSLSIDNNLKAIRFQWWLDELKRNQKYESNNIVALRNIDEIINKGISIEEIESLLISYIKAIDKIDIYKFKGISEAKANLLCKIFKIKSANIKTGLSISLMAEHLPFSDSMLDKKKELLEKSKKFISVLDNYNVSLFLESVPSKIFIKNKRKKSTLYTTFWIIIYGIMCKN